MPISLYIGLGALVAGLLGGWTVRDWKADADALEASQALMEAKDAAQAKIDASATLYEQWRADQEPGKLETRNTIREIFRDAPPVPVECAAPDGIVRLLADKASGANAAAAGQSGAAVPAATVAARPVDGP